jgi:alcohol dehydrogenase YqhD (iron-dependent ADH family)
MENFVYANPTKLVFGKNVISQIGDELKSANISKVLMLAGGGSIKKNGVYDEFTNSLKSRSIDIFELWGVRPNPALEHAEEAIDIIRKNGIQAIVAVGGGSVIDEAKAISIGVDAESLWAIYERREAPKSALPIYTILTISATGSEMNSGAVLTNYKEQKKWPYGCPLMYPKVSYIDPSKQYSLPWNQTVNGAIDAISHIMENYFVMGAAQETVVSYNESLMRSMVKHTNVLQKEPENYDARANFAWIATMALNGYSGIGVNGGDWATHMIEHGISALYPHVAHGEGLAIIFPAWIDYMKDSKPEFFTAWAKNVWNKDSVADGIEAMRAQYKAWGSPTRLSDINIKKENLEAIADNILELSRPGKLKSFDKADIMNILNLAL